MERTEQERNRSKRAKSAAQSSARGNNSERKEEKVYAAFIYCLFNLFVILRLLFRSILLRRFFCTGYTIASGGGYCVKCKDYVRDADDGSHNHKNDKLGGNGDCVYARGAVSPNNTAYEDEPMRITLSVR